MRYKSVFVIDRRLDKITGTVPASQLTRWNGNNLTRTIATAKPPEENDGPVLQKVSDRNHKYVASQANDRATASKTWSLSGANRGERAKIAIVNYSRQLDVEVLLGLKYSEYIEIRPLAKETPTGGSGSRSLSLKEVSSLEHHLLYEDITAILLFVETSQRFDYNGSGFNSYQEVTTLEKSKLIAKLRADGNLKIAIGYGDSITGHTSIIDVVPPKPAVSIAPFTSIGRVAAYPVRGLGIG